MTYPLPSDRRLRYEAIGQLAEQSVAEKLSLIYTQDKVKSGKPGNSGTNGEPDILLITPPGPVYIEVKSLVPFTRRKAKSGKSDKRYYFTNTLKLQRSSWRHLCETAETNHAYPVIVAEVRFNNSSVYFLITKEQVDRHVSKSGVEWCHIPLSYIMTRAHLLSFTHDEFDFTEQLSDITEKTKQRKLIP